MKPIASPYKVFSFESYNFNHATGEALLSYSIDGILFFNERITFPVPADGSYDRGALDRALFALHLACGVSYYKTYLPPEIEIKSGALNSEQAKFWNKLYTLGLGEFFYRNDLAFADYIHFPANAPDNAEPRSIKAKYDGAILPIGGGKDSLLAAQMLLKEKIAFELVALGKQPRIIAVASSLELPLTIIDRAIDPQLFKLNTQGAFNGHVPISSIIAFASAVYAVLHGKADIILANERSANVGNFIVDGIEINHQYSKSLEFERDAQGYIGSAISPSLHYFSLMRPFSELTIVQKFIGFGRSFEVFSSCNGNFKLAPGTPKPRWCGKCAKCAFVFALFSAFLPAEETAAIFDKNLFEDEALIPAYRDLTGIGAGKPFDCVGEPDEVIAALELASRSQSYKNTPVMTWYETEIKPKHNDLDALIEAVKNPSAENAMPERYAKIVYAN